MKTNKFTGSVRTAHAPTKENAPAGTRAASQSDRLNFTTAVLLTLARFAPIAADATLTAVFVVLAMEVLK